MNTIQITTRTDKETRDLGRAAGERIETAMTIALTGDLGSGKTVFAQGLAQGLEVPDRYYVTSPSYTLVNEYPGRLVFFHVDLYRTGGIDEVDGIGLLDILRGDGVVAVEWADRLPEKILLPQVVVHIEFIDFTRRRISLASYGHRGTDLLKKLNKRD